MADIQRIVFDKFLAMYGKPKTPNEEMYLDEYEKALMGWSDEYLERAVDEIIKTHSFQSWPVPGALTAICRRIAPPHRIVDTDTPHISRPRPSAEDRERWDGEMVSFKDFMAAAQARLLGKGGGNTIDWTKYQRPAFEEMQRKSPNKDFHTKPGRLTQVSRRMAGERD